jgi:hypothetical protein
LSPCGAPVYITPGLGGTLWADINSAGSKPLSGIASANGQVSGVSNAGSLVTWANLAQVTVTLPCPANLAVFTRLLVRHNATVNGATGADLILNDSGAGPTYMAQDVRAVVLGTIPSDSEVNNVWMIGPRAAGTYTFSLSGQIKTTSPAAAISDSLTASMHCRIIWVRL